MFIGLEGTVGKKLADPVSSGLPKDKNPNIFIALRKRHEARDRRASCPQAMLGFSWGRATPEDVDTTISLSQQDCPGAASSRNKVASPHVTGPDHF